ncbi:DUF2585 family protein [Roseovarius aestuariivivens]|uniref:DUF2585 family protein n=1 Tax=Roseovarius aestuariivivens TaxID=1888910 RepID=UPI001436A332|nr:DUF2585 family protein [Roseovarius aestuariivivens]
MLTKGLYLAAALGGVIVALTLWAWGQPPICTCGYVKLWEGFIWSSGNSQHVADWYTLSHIVHGMLIILLGRLAKGRLSFSALLIIAIVTGMAWELVEHTDWVLGKFRDVTVYQGYEGDSILNSVMDYVWMWVGFFAAHAISTASVIGLILAMEVSAAIFGRDCLTFTTLQIVYPIDIIDAYQQKINPNRKP